MKATDALVRKYGGVFPANKKIGNRRLYLYVGMIFQKRQNTLDQAKHEREHGRSARIYKAPKWNLWAVYTSPHVGW